MNKIILISILYFALNIVNLHATKEMAQKEKQSCIKCHKTSRGGRRGKPNLRSEGIKYIKKLVEKEGYVPTSRHRQLTFLAAKIKANKLKIDSKAREEEEKKQKAKEDTIQKDIEDKRLADEAKQKAIEDKAIATKKKLESEKKLRIQNKLIAEGKIDPVTLKEIAPVLSEAVKRTLGKMMDTGSNNPMVKGPKTVILRRKNVGPTSYDYLSDWEFDDYF
ncbi:hypothetical protein MJH12_17095 [bacterium]|nr:hypothetical protein [bacterium]